MITFRYQARTGGGTEVDGLISAASLQEAQLQLARAGVLVMGLEPVRPAAADEGIIFPNAFNGRTFDGPVAGFDRQEKTPTGMGDGMKRYEELVRGLLDTKEDLIEPVTERELRLQLTKMKYLQEHFSENVWQRQKQVLDRLVRRAQKEIERNELRRWEAWGKEEGDSLADGGGGHGLFSLFSGWWKTERANRTSKIHPVWTRGQSSEIRAQSSENGDRKSEVRNSQARLDTDVFREQGGVVFTDRGKQGGSGPSGGDAHEESGMIRNIRYWYRVMNRPDLGRQEERYAKAKYEAVWLELQRFIGALLAFYLVTSFFAYLFLQHGEEAGLLVKIYKTAMFKQIVIFLFAAYGLLTLRRHFLKNHLLVDGVLFVAWVGVLWVIVAG